MYARGTCDTPTPPAHLYLCTRIHTCGHAIGRQTRPRTHGMAPLQPCTLIALLSRIPFAQSSRSLKSLQRTRLQRAQHSKPQQMPPPQPPPPTSVFGNAMPAASVDMRVYAYCGHWPPCSCTADGVGLPQIRVYVHHPRACSHCVCPRVSVCVRARPLRTGAVCVYVRVWLRVHARVHFSLLGHTPSMDSFTPPSTADTPNPIDGVSFALAHRSYYVCTVGRIR